MRKPETLRAIPDATRRAKAAHQATASAQRLVTEYRSITVDAVRELRQTMSLADVAAVLGVSRTRVQQLEK